MKKQEINGRWISINFLEHDENFESLLKEYALLPSLTDSADELPTILQVADNFWVLSGADGENILTQL